MPYIHQTPNIREDSNELDAQSHILVDKLAKELLISKQRIQDLDFKKAAGLIECCRIPREVGRHKRLAKGVDAASEEFESCCAGGSGEIGC